MTTVVASGAGGTTVIVHEKKQNACRAAIPAMHIGVAVLCLILNIFLPGIGTIVAGFVALCPPCANPGASGGERVGTLCINFWVGLLQIGTVWFFFLGWIWSIMWGAAFLGMSADYHSGGEPEVTVVNTAPPPQQQPIIITNNTTTVAGQPQQQPQQQQAPPPAYDNQQPGAVAEHKV